MGNFHFYDQNSKILFSGDVDASMLDSEHASPVKDFDRHIKSMKSFHRRYMVANKVCRLWANMVMEMDVNMIVPQHGQAFEGAMIGCFLDWFCALQCGIDLVNQSYYQVPDLIETDRRG